MQVMRNLTESALQGPVETGGPDYHAARAGAVMIDRTFGFLSMRGKDCRDFLQRMSTGDVGQLLPNGAVTTVVTTEKARIVDILRVIDRRSDLLVLANAGATETVKEHLQRYIVLDDVALSDQFAMHALSIIGPASSSSLSRFATFEGKSGTFDWGSSNFHWFRDEQWSLANFVLVANADAIGKLAYELNSLGIPRLSDETFEQLRIEEGVPVYGRELTPDVNPLEAGLQNFVSFTKGCYVGQEVIARLDTYKKLQRSLKGFVVEGVMVEGPGIIESQGKEVGITTSWAYSPIVGAGVALGFLSTRAHDNEILQLRTSRGLIPLRVAVVPFVALQ
jgi:folate-binding protein YgfZ